MMRIECSSHMGFGTDLQGKASHEALLKLQDTEMQLLECIKKCVTLRIKSDREYTSELSAMVTHSQKFVTSQYNSPVFQVKASTSLYKRWYHLLTNGWPHTKILLERL